MGNKYYCFNDGKISKSRREEYVITAVIPYDDIDNETLEVWRNEVAACYWLYEYRTDYFIRAKSTEGDIELIFVRSKEGWFSFGSYILDGRLDFDGSLNKTLNSTTNE